MDDEAVIDDSGRVPIPQAILTKLGLSPGTTVVLELLGDAGVLLHPAEAAPQFVDKNGVLVARGVPAQDLATVERRERDARLAQFIPELDQ